MWLISEGITVSRALKSYEPAYKKKNGEGRMNALVGYTGFVGSNLYETGFFDKGYNSTDIQEAYHTHPDLLVYAGLPAEKYLANHMPEKDYERILDAENNIREIGAKRVVLISTVDVFAAPKGVDEDAEVNTAGLHPYGYHRYLLEQWVMANCENAMIVRLPALFGKNIKKNFLYDYINVVPSMLQEGKYTELAGREPALEKYYNRADNGFYRLNSSEEEKKALKKIFCELGFTALHFTDSRSRYQFYNLKHLHADICVAMKAGVSMLHLATEPVSAGEIYRYLTGKEFVNELSGAPADYDFRTKHDRLYGGARGYICDKGSVLDMIREFVEENS